jgi:hypothetical protein
MRRSLAFASIVLVALVLSSCAKNESTTPGAQAAKHATITMKDGTSASGNVSSTSDKEIVVQGDDKITRTIPMDQVRSIDYSDAATPAPGAATAPPPAAEKETAATPATPTPPAVSPIKKPALPEQETSAPPAGKNALAEAQQKLQPSYVLPVGTKISVRTFQAIDSATAAEGQSFPGEVTKNVDDGDGNVVIPARSEVQIVIKSASKGGHFRGTSDLVLDMKSVMIGGKQYEVDTAAISKLGKEGMGANKRTATYTGGGAALGAIIGAIAGGGKGAAIGALSGAGAGAVTQAATKGTSIKVPAETILTFRLDQQLTISAQK